MNIASLVSDRARDLPSKTAIEANTEIITYQQLDQRIRRLAARLRTAGVGPDDIVAVWMRDTPMNIAAIFAVAYLARFCCHSTRVGRSPKSHATPSGSNQRPF